MSERAVTRKAFPRKKRGPRFVAVEDAPIEGMSDRTRELLALVLIGFCLYGLLSLATFDTSSVAGEGIPRGEMRNLGGLVGYALAHATTFIFGYAAWLPFLGGVAWGIAMFLGRHVERPIFKVIGFVVFTAMISLILAGPVGEIHAHRLAPWGAGGQFGANLSPKLYQAFGGSGRILLLSFGALCSLLIATEWLFSSMVIRAVGVAEKGAAALRRPAREDEEGEYEDEEEDEEDEAELAAADEEADAEGDEESTEESDEDSEEDASGGGSWKNRLMPWRNGRAEDGDADEAEGAEADSEVAEPVEPEEAVADLVDDEIIDEVDDEIVEVPEPIPQPEPRRPVRAKKAKRKAKKAKQVKKSKGPARQPELPFTEPYPFPPIELFHEPEAYDNDETQRALETNKLAIEKRLGSFKVPAKVVAASVGPAVTQYEIQLGEGIKLSKITSYEADLAAALKAVSVRVVAPIPGKGTVGVEVPNEQRQMVVLRELMEEFGRGDDMAIPLYLGKDVAGEPVVEDMARMPHLLVAGTTGSGKSVGVNCILMSILFTRTPQQVRLILIDPKMVELQVYKRVPHLACEVVTNMKKAPQVLEWAVEEMERRYALLSEVGTNHIKSYNRLGQEEVERRLQKPIDPADIYLPYIVVVIDELADLMTVAQKDVEESIQRLAQKSRAVGLHVILATQRPSTDVITGIIKANLPCQMAFKVNRKIDSRVILDSNGAEKLLGHGDMLYVSPTANRMIRAQGAFISEEEIHAVVKFVEENGPKPSFIPNLVQTDTGKGRGNKDRDDLYEKAVEVILGQQRGSATLIQRALAVGYTRATRLLEMMEEDGVVGPFVGSKSRDVLLTLEEWKINQQAIEDELAMAADGIDGEGDFEDSEFDDGDFEDGDLDDGVEGDEFEDGEDEPSGQA